MYVLSNPAPASTGFPGIEHVTLAGASDGLHGMSIWQQAIAPGGITPPHRHTCEEVVLCSAGEGELHVDGRIERFGANTTVIIPPNVNHQIFSVGKEPLRMVAVFAMTPVDTCFSDGSPVELPWRT